MSEHSIYQSTGDSKSSSKLNSLAKTDSQTFEIRPKLGGFLFTYIIFSLPGFLISLVVLLLILIFLIGGIWGFVFEDRSSNGFNLNLEEIRSSGSGSNGVLVYSLNGPIVSGTSSSLDQNSGNIYVDSVRKDFQAIKNNSSIKNVVIAMNTPGGEVYASKILGAELDSLRKHLKQEKLIFYYGEVVASGGLLATCKTSSTVVASEFGETGSIGVLLTLPNFSGTAEKIGYSQTVVKSSPTKDIGNIFRNPTSGEIDYFQNEVNREFSEFKNCVSVGRNIKSKDVDTIATGLTFSNSKAKEYGLVDDLGSLNRAIELAVSNSNLGQNYKVWEIKPNQGILQQFLNLNSLADIAKIFSSNQLTDKITSLGSGKMYAIDELRYFNK